MKQTLNQKEITCGPRKITLSLVFAFSLLVFGQAHAEKGRSSAQTVAGAPQPTSQTTFSMGLWNWSEKIRITAPGSPKADDWANLQANSFALGRREVKQQWGFDCEGILFFGKASGGSVDNSYGYTSGNLNFTGFGGRGGLFYRAEKYLEVGVTVPILFRTLSWPTANGVDVQSGKIPLVSTMGFWRFRPNRNLMLEQGFGPAGYPAQTIWNLQGTYIF